MYARLLSLSAVLAVAACGDREEAATPQNDTAAVATGTADTRTGARPAGTAGAPATTATVIQVQEEVPGLIQEAKFHPLDAQHIAQGKYPEGKVTAGWIERRAGNLVYRFRFNDPATGTNDVLLDANQGTIISTIPVRN